MTSLLQYLRVVKEYVEALYASPRVQEWILLANATYLASSETSRDFILRKLDLDRFLQEKGYITEAEIEALIAKRMTSPPETQEILQKPDSQEEEQKSDPETLDEELSRLSAEQPKE